MQTFRYIYLHEYVLACKFESNRCNSIVDIIRQLNSNNKTSLNQNIQVFMTCGVLKCVLKNLQFSGNNAGLCDFGHTRPCVPSMHGRASA